jgi:hypothetical protein
MSHNGARKRKNKKKTVRQIDGRPYFGLASHGYLLISVDLLNDLCQYPHFIPLVSGDSRYSPVISITQWFRKISIKQTAVHFLGFLVKARYGERRKNGGTEGS